MSEENFYGVPEKIGRPLLNMISEMVADRLPEDMENRHVITLVAVWHPEGGHMISNCSNENYPDLLKDLATSALKTAANILKERGDGE